MLKITVGKNDEDYTTIQEALNAVPYDTEAEIIISEGIYKEKIFSDKSSLVIRGIGNVLITYSDSGYELLDRNRKRGTFRSYTAFFSGKKLKLENLTIANSAGEGFRVGQGIALYLDVEHSVLNDVHLIGHQDTLFLAPLPDEERETYGFYGPRHLLPRKQTLSIFRHCTIEGTVDFIFGGGNAIFNECEIISCGPGYITAPSGLKEWLGMIFIHCRFSYNIKGLNDVYLMRPWRIEGKSYFISCNFDDHIAECGAVSWPGRDDEFIQCTFKTYDCTAEAAFTDNYEMSSFEFNELMKDITKYI